MAVNQFIINKEETANMPALCFGFGQLLYDVTWRSGVIFLIINYSLPSYGQNDSLIIQNSQSTG